MPMKRLRTKIIAVLLLAVLLPVLPLSYLVYTLVNQSYRVGVNPQVSQALENGFYFSRELYNLQRRHLTFILEQAAPRLTEGQDFGQVMRILQQTGLDTAFWKPFFVGTFSAEGEVIWESGGEDSQAFTVPRQLFRELRPEQEKVVLSDRTRNIFQAVVARGKGNQRRFLLLAAHMNPRFLRQTNQLLQVHQVYQTLNLTRHSLPRSFLFAFVALTLLFLSFIIAAGIWISARLTAPLSLLVEGTEEIGRGNLDYRIPETGREDETTRLIRHFNRMAEALQKNQQRLIYLEKMAMWQQIARKLAHEIKNPLTPIQLTLQQLVDQYDDSNPQYRQLLTECSQIINEEIGSLRRLVAEFSRFGRLPQLRLEANDLNQLVGEVAALYGERIHLELAEGLPRFPFDRDRLRRVLINLIENAQQADAENQPITIRTIRDGEFVQLEVSDRGRGIAPEHLERIFEPYFSTRKEGMGLGLAITRLIVEEHNGSIRVESRPGEGTTFFIRLPLVPRQGAPDLNLQSESK